MSSLVPPNTNDRILDAVRAIIRTEIQNQRLTYIGYFDYSIDAVSGDPPNVTLDCTPSDSSLGLPALTNISMQPGIDGITTIPSAGQHCVVAFLNRDPTLPRIVGVDSLGVNPIARLGDQVTMFVPPAMPFVITASIAGPAVGVANMATPITGTITAASGKVFTG